jgi:hypothetical protein
MASSIAPRLVQPGENDDVPSDLEPVEAADERLLDLQPRVRGTLESLFGRVGRPLEGRAYPPDRLE